LIYIDGHIEYMSNMFGAPHSIYVERVNLTFLIHMAQTQTTQTPNPDEVIEAPWRSTSWGGVTRPVALRREGSRLRVVNPVNILMSRSGRHGLWLYRRGDLDVLLYLEMSNSGKPSVSIEICDLPQDACSRIYDTAYKAWVVDGVHSNQVERLLGSLEL
jgi:hypothetical protein